MSVENSDPIKIMRASLLLVEQSDSLTSKQIDDALSAILSGQIDSTMIEEWLRLISRHLPTTQEIIGGIQANRKVIFAHRLTRQEKIFVFTLPIALS